jgi:streptogrisin C
MRLHRSRRPSRLLTGVLAALASSALVLASSTSATAQDARPGADAQADRNALLQHQAEQVVHDTLQRDLGISAAEVDRMLDALVGVDDTAASLQADLGDAYGGSWFDQDALTLVVAVTEPALMREVRAAGAQPKLVRHSERHLDAIHGELDALVKEDADAMADAFSWTVDVRTNEVVLTVRAGEADSFSTLAGEFDSALRIEESENAPQTLSHDNPWLDGGVEYSGICSTGFNVRNPNTGARYFLTAGHCGNAGNNTTHGGIAVGPFVESWFPTFDDAIVQVTNTFWAMGPFVWTYPGLVVINGARSSAIGTPICSSGMTTGLTCGTITDKNVTVNYPQGTVFGMGQHNACVEPGDSGGANYSTVGGNFAEGITSGGQLVNGQFCLGRFGQPSVSFYQEVTSSLSYYGQVYGVQLWTG